MKNMKISKKLAISYFVVLVMLIISIVISLFNLSSIGNQVETFYNGPFTASAAANVINERFEGMQKATYRAISNDSTQITNQAIQDAKSASSTLMEQMPVVKEHFMGDKQLVTNLEKILSELAPMREKVLELASQNKNQEAAAYMEENNIPKIKEAQDILDTIIQAATTNGENLISSLRAAQTRAVIVLIVLGIVSVLVSIVFALYITRSITGPVSEIEAAADDLSNGKLDSAITYHSQDELGKLADSMRDSMKTLSGLIHDIDYLTSEIATGNFNVRTRNESVYVGSFRPILDALRRMNINLSDTLGQINESSEQVASGSEQVSSGAQALSQGATEQASAVEELAATVNEISSQVARSAENAIQASEKAGSVGAEMTTSNEKMKEMIAAMGRISDSSSEIGKIIKTIEDIAFQTNILALNAAVEAARAGAAGKGFAVVADEVRNLASKSAEASKNTAALIEASIKAVKDGTTIADETAKSLVEAVEGAKDVVSKVNMISDASQEQASSIAQVTQGIDQISNVVQTNSATAEESAAASEELSGQAQMLKSLVGRFKLYDKNSTGSVRGANASVQEYRQEKVSTNRADYAAPAMASSYSDKY